MQQFALEGTTLKNKYKLLVPNTLTRAGWDVLKERSDIDAEAFPNTVAPADLHARLAGVHGIALGLTRFGEAELAAAPQMRAVARIGVGYDTVDVAALTRAGVPLLVTGIANSVSVAEQALYFMLALAKQGPALDALVKSGRWLDRTGELPSDLFGKTVLVIGLGRIGSRLARRCVAMEMNVLVLDPYVAPDAIRTAGCEPVADLAGALPRADFVSIHCPKTPETVGLIDAARLALFKPTAFLINTARGGLVDEKALYEALRAGRLRGAALDVFDPEPPLPDSPLLKLGNVLTAPHVAGVTREAFDRMCATAVRNLISVLDGAPAADHVINPEILEASGQQRP